ncbi:DUF7504 family protein [Haladaptatus sp. NG-WS-4]
MVCRGETSAHTAEPAAVFTRTLAGLKRRGSGLLLVGADPTLTQACDRFLGESETDPRYRLFVRTDDNCTHSDAAASGRVKCIERATRTRSTAASTQPTAAKSTPPVDTTVLTKPSLSALGIAISDAIAEFEGESGGLQPGELRVCFDSLTPLFEEHTRESVFRFLHILTARVRNVNGMAHFHLPAEMESALVTDLAPIFDAIVEVRTAGGHAEQRWKLVQQDVTTDWLSL